MSKKCRAYSESRLGLAPADNRNAFYAGWDAALREALAEQPAQQQEPVAKVVSTAPERIWLDLGFDPEVEDEISFDDLFEATWSHDNATGNGIEYVRADLAPASKPWVGLTDEEIDKIAEQLDETTIGWSTHEFARAIEAAHGIKE